LPVRGWQWAVFVAVYVAAVALAARLLFMVEDRGGSLLWYSALLAVFFVLFALVWIRPRMRPPLLHLIVGIQCLVVLALLAPHSEFDYVTSFFGPLAYQAALVFRGRTRWTWVGVFALLTGGSLMIGLGPIRGLGMALTTIAVEIALPALAIVSEQFETARDGSRQMLSDLEATNEQLKKYAAEVEDLATVEERNRLARELHDSVSQAMFGIVLATRSAQIMRERDPGGVPAQLERLQVLTQEALARMRGFISELRPKPE
jgi:signal transduction histidine kinase